MNKIINNKIYKIMAVIVFFFLVIISENIVFATSNLDSETLEELKEEAKNLNLENIPIDDIDLSNIDNMTEEELLDVYDKVTQEYDTQDIAEIIEDNKEELKKQGIGEDVINAGTEILKTTDTETVREILKEDVDITEIKEKIKEGYSPEEIVKSVVKEIPTKQKVNIAMKLFVTNSIIKTVLVVLGIIFIYDLILRWRIYQKAGEHGWAAIIPIYRDIVMYRISDLSPWLLLLWFVPILGWIILFGASIIGRICLAGNFGRGTLFALGNVLIPIVFESVIAFNPNIKYEQE